MPELSAGILRTRFARVVEERALARCLSARSGVAWESDWKPEVQPEAPLRADVLAAALHKGQSFLATLQNSDGHRIGYEAQPMFLLLGLVISLFVSHMRVKNAHRAKSWENSVKYL